MIFDEWPVSIVCSCSRLYHAHGIGSQGKGLHPFCWLFDCTLSSWGFTSTLLVSHCWNSVSGTVLYSSRRKLRTRLKRHQINVCNILKYLWSLQLWSQIRTAYRQQWYEFSESLLAVVWALLWASSLHKAVGFPGNKMTHLSYVPMVTFQW